MAEAATPNPNSRASLMLGRPCLDVCSIALTGYHVTAGPGWQSYLQGSLLAGCTSTPTGA